MRFMHVKDLHVAVLSMVRAIVWALTCSEVDGVAAAVTLRDQ
jgi:hypothetical protein